MISILFPDIIEPDDFLSKHPSREPAIIEVDCDGELKKFMLSVGFWQDGIGIEKIWWEVQNGGLVPYYLDHCTDCGMIIDGSFGEICSKCQWERNLEESERREENDEYYRD